MHAGNRCREQPRVLQGGIGPRAVLRRRAVRRGGLHARGAQPRRHAHSRRHARLQGGRGRRGHHHIHRHRAAAIRRGALDGRCQGHHGQRRQRHRDGRRHGRDLRRGIAAAAQSGRPDEYGSGCAEAQMRDRPVRAGLHLQVGVGHGHPGSWHHDARHRAVLPVLHRGRRLRHWGCARARRRHVHAAADHGPVVEHRHLAGHRERDGGRRVGVPEPLQQDQRVQPAHEDGRGLSRRR